MKILIILFTALAFAADKPAEPPSVPAEKQEALSRLMMQTLQAQVEMASLREQKDVNMAQLRAAEQIVQEKYQAVTKAINEEKVAAKLDAACQLNWFTKQWVGCPVAKAPEPAKAPESKPEPKK